MATNRLLTVSVFYHLGLINVFHHDSPAFSVSGHLWIDAMNAHVTFQSVKPSHFSFERPLVRVPVTFVLSVLLGMWVSSLYITCPYHDSLFCVRTELIDDSFAFPVMVPFVILSFLVFPRLHLSIFISVVCKRCSSCLHSAQHSLPYTIAGLTTVLFCLFFSFMGTFLS